MAFNLYFYYIVFSLFLLPAVNARKQLQENKLGQSLEHRSKISRDYLRSREEVSNVWLFGFGEFII